MPTWEQQGAHRYYVEGDVLIWESHGEITLADITATFAILKKIYDSYGYTLSAYDASRGGHMGPIVRRYIADMGREYDRQGASALFGAGVTMRTLMLLLHNAARLFNRRQMPLYFCATQEEAIKWLQAQRQIYKTAQTVQASKSGKNAPLGKK